MCFPFRAMVLRRITWDISGRQNDISRQSIIGTSCCTFPLSSNICGNHNLFFSEETKPLTVSLTWDIYWECFCYVTCPVKNGFFEHEIKETQKNGTLFGCPWFLSQSNGFLPMGKSLNDLNEFWQT